MAGACDCKRRESWSPAFRVLGPPVQISGDRAAILVILLIGLFPLISLLVSVENINMTEEDTSFHGVVQYLALFRDARLWLALLAR